MLTLDGYTGHLYEIEVLGQCEGPWDGKSYMTYEASMAFAECNQPARKQPAARNLQTAVSDLMGGTVEFFTAVGTPLDRFHGVDAWLVFEGHVVTIDVTLNSDKDVAKAHIVFNPHEMDFDDLAALAARELNMKLRRGGNVWRA